MKSIVLAYHNIGCSGIKALLKNGIDISAIFTHKDELQENIWFESVAELAAIHDIAVFAPDDINHPIWVQRIIDLEPDIIFSFYYRKMIKPAILEIPPMGCLNLHGSLLPKYRGRCPINWMLINGETKGGLTLHYMTSKPDDGDIVAQKGYDILEEDTAKSIYTKAIQSSSEMLEEILPQIKRGTAQRFPQDHSQASYYGGRRPKDGEINWNTSASDVRNLVRAVSHPYPGAFSYIKEKKCFFWKVTETTENFPKASPGTILSTNPLTIACTQGAIIVNYAQQEEGIYMNGGQLAKEIHLAEVMSFGPFIGDQISKTRKKSVLILGVNGFIGNHLSERLLKSGKYTVHGMDLHSTYIQHLIGHPDFNYSEGDISIHRQWIEYHVKKCDIVVPLVAIATPIEYTRNPIRVFELDFEENLRIVRYCVKYKKRVIFPSTSEVYGMCDDDEFDENHSNLILGPIRMQRWIYSCSKQLLDRVIWAYGQKEGLRFTLFRPFNWIGPKLDTLMSARVGSSRAITQLILNLTEGSPIQLVDGGQQKRCFTDVNEGIECLFRIIENENETCNGKIINIGNPVNEASIKELAEILINNFMEHSLRSKFPPFAGFQTVESQTYYGSGYQDVQHRRPSIKTAQRLVNWTPKIQLEESVKHTLDYFLQDTVSELEQNSSESN
jgi:UDP-4-amino-4-deoxy-L-arabinose formyltransferase/UDP-glucuronic acid dehydrogenase (UDP-4-keto-hexauronic acid decarboxylating)